VFLRLHIDVSGRMEDEDYDGGYGDDQDYDYEFPDDGEDDEQALLEQINREKEAHEKEMAKERKGEQQYQQKDEDEDDEQHAQKVNGQKEAVQEALRKCENELSQVKEDADKTKIKLAEAMTTIKELQEASSSQLNLASELQEARLQILSLQNQLKQETATPSPPPVVTPTDPVAPPPSTPSYSKLMKSFLNLSTQHSFDSYPATDSTELTETICLSLLTQTNKKLSEQQKQLQQLQQQLQQQQEQQEQQHPQYKKSSSVAGTVTVSSTGGGGGGGGASDSELQQRINNLEEELRLALGAAEDIRALKAKAISLVERIRVEKEEKLRCESEQKVFIKKIEMLSDHVEKLMIHLKHEAATKIKTIDQLRASEKRNESAQLKLGIVSRKAAAKDRLIAELREGSKILEDQLRLMDEKYLELRTKLDYAREVASKKVKIAQKTASDLRVKFALAGNTKLLDHIPLPDINSTSIPLGGTGDYFYSSSDGYGGGGGGGMGSPGGGGGSGGGGGDYGRSMSGMSMTSPTPLSRSMGSANNLLLKSGGTASGGGGGAGGTGNRKKASKKKFSSQTIAKDTEQSTERVLDKIRRLRGGQQEWTEEKIRNLVKSH
jgi:hypothetical protein